MAVIQGRTREQLRQSVGYNLGAMRTSIATGGSTTTVVDAGLVAGGNDRFNGHWLILQDDNASTNDGIIRRVTDSSVSSNVYTLTFSPATLTAVASPDTYEIWDDKFPPQRINDFINQAIIDATGHTYTYKENISLHGDGSTARFDVPSTLQMIQRVEYRSKVTSKVIHRCDTTFDEATDSDFTQASDTQNKKQGTGSLKITVAAGASAGDLISDSITSVDISKYDTVEMWVKSTVATSAGNLKLLLDDSASCASPIETLEIPALTADTWTFVRMSLDNPETDTAIISVGLEYDSDLGACVINIDDIVVVAHDTSIWTKLDRRAWHIDKQQKDLILHDDGRSAVGYKLIKLIGGAKPALLSDDSTSNEIDDQYVITRTTGMALASVGGGANTDHDSAAQRAAFWFGLAEQAKRSFPMLVDVRLVE
jgi:hypothetical protein